MGELREVKELDVWNPKIWEDYFEKTRKIGEACRDILLIHEGLAKLIDRKPLDEVIASDSLRKIMLGGLQGSWFADNSMASFYHRLFGVSISALQEFISRLKCGFSLQDAARDLQGRVERSPLIELVEKISTLSNRILQAASEKGLAEPPPPLALEEKAELILNDPYIAQKALVKLLESSLVLSPNCNPLSFFLLSLHRISRAYLRFAYPEIIERGGIDFVRDNFGFSPVITPSLPSRELEEDYTIWGFPGGSLGSQILELLGYLWDLTENEPLRKFFNLESERLKYIGKALAAWEEAVCKEEPAEEVVDVLANVSVPPDFHEQWGPLRIHARAIHRFPRAARKGSYTLEGVNARFETLVEMKPAPEEKLPPVFQQEAPPYIPRLESFIGFGEKEERLSRRGFIPFPMFIDYISPALFLSLGFLEKSSWGAPILRR